MTKLVPSFLIILTTLFFVACTQNNQEVNTSSTNVETSKEVALVPVETARRPAEKTQKELDEEKYKNYECKTEKWQLYENGHIILDSIDYLSVSHEEFIIFCDGDRNDKDRNYKTRNIQNFDAALEVCLSMSIYFASSIEEHDKKEYSKFAKLSDENKRKAMLELSKKYDYCYNKLK